MAGRFSSWMQRPGSHWFVIAFGLVLVAPSLFAGLFADDYFHYGILNGAHVMQRDDFSLFNLFSFIDANPQRKLQLMDMSLIPWWTVPKFQYNFWRPLTELTHYIDYTYLVRHEMLMHLHSLLWFAALLVAVRYFYRQLSAYWTDAEDGSPGVRNLFVVLALAAYAWDSTHGMTIAWLSNRNALIAALLVLLVLQQHMRYREQGGVLHLLLAVVLLVCALLAAEIGITAGAYLFAFAVFLDRAGAVRGFIALLPYAVVVIAWWLVYKHFGYGAAGSVLYYVDPGENPAFFLQQLLVRLPLFVGSQFGMIPAEAALFSPFIKTFAVIAGVVIMAWIAVLLSLLRARRLAGFLCVGTLLAMLPVSSAIPQDRNLLLVGIGGSGLIALLMAALWQTRLRLRGAGRFGVAASVVMLAACHLVFSPLLLVPLSLSPKLLSAPATKTALSLADDARQVVAFNVPVQSVTYLVPTRYKLQKPLPEKLWSLTSSEAPADVERVADNVLRIRQVGGFLQNDDRLLRHPTFDPLRVGDHVALTGLDIEITATTEDGRPAEITATFAGSLSDPRYQFMYWYKNQFYRFDLGVGETRRLPLAEPAQSGLGGSRS